MPAISTSPYHISMSRKRNIWYSVKNGNWSDPSVWMSNGAKKYGIPQPNDDVVINHNIGYNNANNGPGLVFNPIINNLFVNGTLSWVSGNQSRLYINGNLQCKGTVDLSASTGGGGAYVFIGGVDNFFNNFITGNSVSNITIAYTAPHSFCIPNLNYYNLEIGGSGTKTISNDLSVAGILSVDNNVAFELGNYNVSVKDIAIYGTLSKNSSTGAFTVTNANGSGIQGAISFTGNPTVNWSGDFGGDVRYGVNFGTGTFNILTNSTWNFGSNGNIPSTVGNNYFLIASGCTLTVNSPAAWLNTGTVNGVDGTSTLNIDTGYGFGNANTVMATGVFNYNYSGTSTIYVDNSATLTLPVYTFYNLTINSGTATLGANTVVNNNCTVSGSLQFASYNFSCANITSVGGSVLASGAGTLSFNIINLTGVVSFTGNPTVNISGNFSGDCRNGVNFGNVAVNILQSITWGSWTSGNVAAVITTSFLIASGKTMQNIGLSSTLGGIQTTGRIAGADSSAIFDNRSIIDYQNAKAPMATGKLYCNQAANTFIYGSFGNQDITVPSDATPGYQNLTLNGSGAKRLLGNVSVKGAYTLTSPATLNTNGYALTNP